MPEARVIVVIATAIGTIVLLHATLATTASAEAVLQKPTTAVEASDRVLFCIEKAEQPSETIAHALLETYMHTQCTIEAVKSQHICYRQHA